MPVLLQGTVAKNAWAPALLLREHFPEDPEGVDSGADRDRTVLGGWRYQGNSAPVAFELSDTDAAVERKDPDVSASSVSC